MIYRKVWRGGMKYSETSKRENTMGTALLSSLQRLSSFGDTYITMREVQMVTTAVSSMCRTSSLRRVPFRRFYCIV